MIAYLDKKRELDNTPPRIIAYRDGAVAYAAA